MKKIFLLALTVVTTLSAQAADSDALKAIMKAKTYAEAQALLTNNLGQLASNDEKAKAYNKLVDLAMQKFDKESAIVTSNQMAKQFGQGKEEPYDTLGMGDALCDALAAAQECDKYDQLPNAKGKVKPLFSEKNKQRLWNQRANLVNIGQTAAQNGNSLGVLKYWGTFLDTDDATLFAGCDKTAEKDYIGQVASYAARYAYQEGQIDRAMKYCDIAMQDEQMAKEALDLKLYMMKSGLKTREDSLQYVERLKAEYAKAPTNDNIMDNLYNMYVALKDNKAAAQVLDDRLAQDPNNFVALADKGMMAINDNDADKAVEYLKKATQVNPENAVVWTYLGACLNVQASNTATAAQGKPIFKEAIDALDKAKQLDPDKTQANWGYNRYQAYYGYYGPNAPETKAAEADSK